MKGNARVRPTKKGESFYRFLRPGALAQLRNSQILARSHKPSSLLHFTACRADSPRAHSPQQISVMCEVPCFLGNMVFGPPCLKRKKLVAARSVYFLNLGTSSPVLETPGTSNRNSNSDSSLINVHTNLDPVTVQ